MENILVGLITLGGLYTIAQQEKKETFVPKPFDEQNKIVETNETLDSIPVKYNNSDVFLTLAGEKMDKNELRHNNEVHYYGTNVFSK